MVSVESFIDLVKKRDIGRIKFAIRETNFNIDTKDEVSSLFLTRSFLKASQVSYLPCYACRKQRKEEHDHRKLTRRLHHLADDTAVRLKLTGALTVFPIHV